MLLVFLPVTVYPQERVQEAAATCTWTATDHGNWENGDNWDCDGESRIPDSGDAVTIGTAPLAGRHVTINSSAHVAQLTLSANRRLIVKGGLTVKGDMSWTCCAIDNGNVSADPNGSVDIEGTLTMTGTNHSQLGRIDMTVSGSAVLDKSENGLFTIGTNASFKSVNTFTILNGAQIGGSGTLINEGTVAKSGGADRFAIDPVVNSTGTISNESGTLAFQRGGLFSGSLNTTAGAVMEFGPIGGGLQGPLTQTQLAASLSGKGTFMLALGTLETATPITVPTGATFLVHNGTLKATEPFVVDGNLEWRAGTVTGPAPVTVNKDAGLILSHPSKKNLDGIRMTNHGSGYVPPGNSWNVELLNDASFINGADANFRVAGSILFWGNGAFTNAGLFIADQIGTGIATNVFENSGVIHFIDGQLSIGETIFYDIPTPFQNTGTIRGNGTLNLDLNAPFTNTGTFAPERMEGDQVRPGIITVSDAPYPNGTLEIDIDDDTGAGTGHDQLQIFGVTPLGGQLRVDASRLAEPGEFVIVTCSGSQPCIRGTFSTTLIEGPYGMQVEYNENNVKLIIGGPPPVVVVVNSTGDEPDIDLDDNACDTGGTILRDGTPEPECTLRAAIMEANGNPGSDIVSFNIPGELPYLIQIDGSLPTITDPLILDATSQPGYAGHPIIVLTTNDNDLFGLWIKSGESTVKGFVFNGFGTAIVIEEKGENKIAGNYIGLDATGLERRANGTGIRIDNTSTNIIGGLAPEERNVISGSHRYGIRIQGSLHNRIEGNYIGTDAAGAKAIPNHAGGIFIEGGAENRIGGSLPGSGNVISGNVDFGLYLLETAGNSIRGNSIGVNLGGATSIAGQRNGIIIERSTGTLVGGTPSERNVISGHEADGVEILGRAESAIELRNNFIGVTAAGDAALPNGGHGVRIEETSGVLLRGNVISGNGAAGIFITGEGSFDTRILGNTIGWNASRQSSLANAENGLRVEASAGRTTVGGLESSEENHIYGGIRVLGAGARPVGVLRNNIEVADDKFSGSARLQPVDFGESGPSCVPWSGPAVPAPRLLNITANKVTGQTRPGATVVIYRSITKGSGQMRYFSRKIEAMGHGVADVTGHFSAALQLNEGDEVTAVATDADGNSSEAAQLRRPVVFLPGIGGSKLKDGLTDVWLPTPFPDAWLNNQLYKMRMHPDGTDQVPLAVDGILETIFGQTTIYGPILAYFEANGFPGSGTMGSERDWDLWRFPYDWRRDVRLPARDLKKLIEHITSRGSDIAPSCEVDIVAHSMGGLVSGFYLHTEVEHSQDRVHRFVNLGTPYLGTPQAAAGQTAGYVFELEKELSLRGFELVDIYWGWMLDMSRNLTAAYGLMPARTYWDASRRTGYLPDLHGKILTSHNATVRFLANPKFDGRGRPLGLARNFGMWREQIDDVHGRIDDWRGWDRPPHIYRLAGDMPGSTSVGWYIDPRLWQRNPRLRPRACRFPDERCEPDDSPQHWAYRNSLIPILGLGDGTVSLSSGSLGHDDRVGRTDYSGVDSPWIERFEYYQCSHMELAVPGCSDPRSLAFDRTLGSRVLDILRSGHTAAIPNVGKSTDEPAAIVQDLLYLFGSERMGVVVEDSQGRRTGPINPDSLGAIRRGIPELPYWPNALATVVALPPGETFTFTAFVPDGGDVSVTLVRTGGDNNEQALYPDQQLEPGGSIRHSLISGISPLSAAISVDADGDGSFEQSASPSVQFSASTLSPAVPVPQPFGVDEVFFLNEADPPSAEILLPDVGGPVWTYRAELISNTFTLAATTGTTPAGIEITLSEEVSVPVELIDTLTIQLTYDSHSLTYVVPIRFTIEKTALIAQILVSPEAVTLIPGQTHPFTAEIFDQGGNSLISIPMWSATGGTIDQNGLYTAGDELGTFEVVASDSSRLIFDTAVVHIVEATSAGEDGALPGAFSLHPNYPNPFNPSTTITFDVQYHTHVVLRVYDMVGRQVATLVDGPHPAGRHTTRFEADDLPSGLYLYTIQMGNFRAVSKMILLK